MEEKAHFSNLVAVGPVQFESDASVAAGSFPLIVTFRKGTLGVCCLSAGAQATAEALSARTSEKLCSLMGSVRPIDNKFEM